MLTHRLRRFVRHYCTSQCDLCGLTIDDKISDAIWCHNCIRHFQQQPRCACCGLPTLTPVPKCGQCLINPPIWNRLYCVGDYQSPLSGYVQKLKYQSRYRFAYDLTRLLSERIDNPAPVIIPVPLHWKRYIKRGYNQSDILARYLCQHLNHSSQVKRNIFKRCKSTPPQQGLSQRERQQNLKNAFRLCHSPEHKHVAIIDDVVTTGSTVRHLCQLLLDIEVEKIDIYCICRTPEPKEDHG